MAAARLHYTGAMRKTVSLSRKLLLIGTAFLIVALASIGFTLWVTWQLEGGAAAINEAGRLRMLALQLELARHDGAVSEADELRARFARGLELLRQGDPARPLFVPWNDVIREAFDRIEVDWQAYAGQGPASTGSAPATRQVTSFVAEIDRFVQTVEIQIMRWTAGLHLFQLLLVAITIATAVAFIALTYLLVLGPVTRLQQALAAMRRGQLGTRLAVESDDEFGQLAAGFNLMAHSLQESHADLERKVDEKTASLAARNEHLASLYAVSALSAQASSLETLAQGFAALARRASGCDAVLVRWADRVNERFVLLAADGVPPSMFAHEQCLVAGACACGQLATQAGIRAMPVPPADAAGIALPHCRDAGFRGLVTIPVRLQNRPLGEVTLLYRETRELAGPTRELLASMAQHLANSMEGLRAAGLEREAAVAEERRLLARELHDSIAQSLAFLKIQIRLLRDAVASRDVAARDRGLDELDVGVRECLADVRELLIHFRTRTQDEDIEDALRATISKFEHQTGVPTTIELSGHGLPLASDVQIQVLHVVQEALSNVRKHAQAERAELRVQRHPHWRFEVRDNGRGFDPGAVPPDSLHVGIGIMRERAQRIGATLALESRPGEGTRVVLELPGPVGGKARPAALA